jgi:hypothetical protein
LAGRTVSIVASELGEEKTHFHVLARVCGH